MRRRIGIEERFWSKVDRSQLSPGGCWEWRGARSKAGYGHFVLRFGTGKPRRQWYAHRLALVLSGIQIPSGAIAMHRCDNPPCVNPAHLLTGTHADNSRDMVTKNRQASGDRNGSRLHAGSVPRGDGHYSRICPDKLERGEDRWMAKLTEESVREIRRRYAAGGVSQYTLAREFGVSRPLIGMVIRRQWWKHVD